MFNNSASFKVHQGRAALSYMQKVTIQNFKKALKQDRKWIDFPEFRKVIIHTADKDIVNLKFPYYIDQKDDQLSPFAPIQQQKKKLYGLITD